MSPQLIALLQKIEKEDLAILAEGLVPAIFEEIQKLSASQSTISAIEAVVFPAVLPAAQSAFASLIAKLPVVA